MYINHNCEVKKTTIIFLVALVGAAVLFFFNPVDYKLMPKCIFKMLTGLSCPGCGIQRCIHAMLHGRFLEGIGYNYFLIWSGPYALAFGIEEFLLPAGPAKQRMKRVLEHKYMVYPFVVMVLVWTVVRNLLGI